MATKFNVVYDDGSTVQYTVKPKHILKVEREKGGLEANIESSYMLAWLSADSGVDFDTWLDGVTDITPEDEGDVEEDANPT